MNAEAQYQQAVGRTVSAFAGALSAMHENLGKVQAQVNAEDANDLDNARVYMEAAFWKLEIVLARQEPTTTTVPTSKEK